MNSSTFTNDNSLVANQANVIHIHGDSVVQHAPGPLAQLPHAAEASFNSYVNRHEPVCLDGTRVDLLNKIYGWAEGQDELCILWLRGLAGTGKSTIARTVAGRYCYDDKGRLAASFFFSRGSGDVGHAGKFVTSIAVQLAYNVPASRKYICAAVAERGDIASQLLRDQWQHLVLSPLSKLDQLGPYIIVIDALDECDNDEDVRSVVQLLAEARSLKTVRLRVLLTSRPELPIRDALGQIPRAEHQDFVLHDISPPIVDEDIRLYLETELRAIEQRWYQPARLTSAETIVQLVESAGGLFIWAATAHRFISQGRQYAAGRLETILRSDGNTVAAPEKHLDQIYITVLQNSVSADYTKEEREWHCNMLKYVLGSVVVLLSTLSVWSLSKLLQSEFENVRQVLGDLHAILNVPEDPAQPLRLHHPSFRDFLLDEKRCSDNNFWVDGRSIHEKLASCCLKLMSAQDGLRKNICNLSRPEVLRSGISESLVAANLLPELQYACQYWIDHLEHSQRDIEDADATHRFLQKHLLHWLEAMSLINETSLCVRLVARLRSLVAPSSNSVATFLYDAHRFVLRFVSILADAPLQIYLSGLAFSPEASIVRKFNEQVLQEVSVVLGRDTEWDACRSVLEGHSGPVNVAVFSPDGQLIASASDDSTVRVWETATGRRHGVLEGHLSKVNVVVFSPDGQLIASASDDSTVRVWETATGRGHGVLKDHSDLVSAVVFSPNGQLVASASKDGTVRVWETATEQCRSILDGNSGYVWKVLFSPPDGRLIASSFGNGELGLWETATERCRNVLKSNNAYDVTFSPDGQLIASASYDRTVLLWETKTGQYRRVLKGHSDTVWGVVFSPDGQLIASASSDRTVRVWETATGQCRSVLEGHSSGVNTVVFSPDGQLIASASYDGTVRVWKTATGQCRSVLEGHSSGVNTVVFSPDGHLVASASHDSTVRVWETATGLPQDITEGHEGRINAVAFSPDGRLVVTASDDSTVRMWNTTIGQHLGLLQGHSDCVNMVLFSPDGELVASSSNDGTVRLWEMKRKRHCTILKGGSGPAIKVAFSPDGKLVASTYADCTIWIWHRASKKRYSVLGSHSMYIHAILFSPDGQLIASASRDRTVRVWETATGRRRGVLEGHSDDVNAVVFSPDGRLLASASDDRTVRVWETATRQCRYVLENQPSSILHIAFSLDGSTLQTDRGVIPLPPDLVATSVHVPTNDLFYITVGSNWVLRQHRPFLWLPPEYRDCVVAADKQLVCLGCISGRVALLSLS